jgi:glutamate/aspartate transport system substrate-binding protein
MTNIVRGIAASCLLLVLGAVAPGYGQGLGPTLEKIKSQKTITIGYRETSVPLSYLDNEQKPVGFSIDLCQLVVQKVKAKLGLPDLQTAYVAVTSSTRMPLISNGTIDIECGSTANNVPRQQQVAFSVTTFAPQFRWIALKDSGLKSTEDLKGKTVILTSGSNTNGFVATLNGEQSLGMTILKGKDHAESFIYVETGRAAAFMEDDILLAGLKANNKNPNAFVFLKDEYLSDPYALMFRKDDAPFKQIVDGALTEAMKSGEYAKLYAKWFESPVPPKGINLTFPMSERLKGLIQNPSDKANGQ